MIAVAGAVTRHPGVVLASRRAPLRAAPARAVPARAVPAHRLALLAARAPAARRRPAPAPGAAIVQAGVTILKLAAGILAGATAALAVMNYQGSSERVAPAVEPARNETVVYRQTPTKAVARMLPAAAAVGEPEERDLPAYYPRSVQTVRFVNPSPHETTFMLAAVEPTMTKVGGFVAFPGNEAVETITTESHRSAARPGFPRKRGMVTTVEVDDYLWDVYQRAPIKKDGSGDFTWKDPAAASRMGLSLKDYVIVGMDPDFREQLYHAGRAMDEAGIQWALLSAFRDDYRQKIASGFKARTGNSLHGGSRRTGGYGHGRAIDITSTDGDHWTVWKWLDANGGKYGLYRPMPSADPAHVQSKGDWRKLAQNLRQTRSKIAEATGATAKDAGKTKVATAEKR